MVKITIKINFKKNKNKLSYKIKVGHRYQEINNNEAKVLVLKEVRIEKIVKIEIKITIEIKNTIVMTIKGEIKVLKRNREKILTWNINQTNIKIKESTITKDQSHVTVRVVIIETIKEMIKTVIDNKKMTDNLHKKMTIIGIKGVNQQKDIPETEEIIMIEGINIITDKIVTDLILEIKEAIKTMTITKNNVNIIQAGPTIIRMIIKNNLNTKKDKWEIIKIIIKLKIKIRRMNKITTLKFSIDQ